MAYAEVEDLEARWRPLSPSEKERAETLLEDAAVRIDAACPPPAEPTEAQLEARKIVSCEMVKRAMISGSDAGIGVSSTQDTVGPFSRSLSYSNPMGDLYLTKQDKALLGCRGGKARSINTIPNPEVRRGRVEEVWL